MKMNENILNAEMDYRELNVQDTANKQSTASSFMMISPTATGVCVGPESSRVTCLSCRAVVFTRVKHKSTSRTHLNAILMCFCCLSCCLPYCIDSFKNANHYCPSCDSFLATYQS